MDHGPGTVHHVTGAPDDSWQGLREKAEKPPRLRLI
jgi:hypothetical protein